MNIKRFFTVSFLTFCLSLNAQNIINSDIENFWQAYDKIILTKDSATQYKLLDDLYLSKATKGLNAIREARQYTNKDYIDAINNYPKFWNSVRKNTLKSKYYVKELNKGIEKLREIYPDLKPATIYFTIGALRSNGTTLDDMVLIGSEFAMSDQSTITDEFPENTKNNLRKYFDTNPINDLILLNIHEYIHTQQKNPGNDLLSIVINEGIAEFVSTKTLDVPSPTPAISFGKKNAEKVRAKFEQEMFYYNNINNWLWSNSKNEFDVRDLGYYVGYQISENYYNQAKNKKQALKELIDLDFSNEKQLNDFIKKSNYFSKPLEDLRADFEQNRPTIIGIKQFKNQSTNVDPSIKEITLQFSKPLNGYNTGLDFGNLGEMAFPKNDVTKRTWSEDHLSWTIPVELLPNKKYQLLITENFRTKDGYPLKPYLIEFETTN